MQNLLLSVDTISHLCAHRDLTREILSRTREAKICKYKRHNLGDCNNFLKISVHILKIFENPLKSC